MKKKKHLYSDIPQNNEKNIIILIFLSPRSPNDNQLHWSLVMFFDLVVKYKNEFSWIMNSLDLKIECPKEFENMMHLRLETRDLR